MTYEEPFRQLGDQMQKLPSIKVGADQTEFDPEIDKFKKWALRISVGIIVLIVLIVGIVLFKEVIKIIFG